MRNTYQCEKMSDCPYTGTTLINKIPWEDCPALKESEEREEAVIAEEDSKRWEERENSEMNEARVPA